MVSGSCDAYNGHARWPQLLFQGSPHVGQDALIPLQSQGANLELKVPVLNATLTRKHYEPLQLGEVHPMEKGSIEVITIILKSFDQLRKQLLTLLVRQSKNMLKGVHDGIDAAQIIGAVATIRK